MDFDIKYIYYPWYPNYEFSSSLFNTTADPKFMEHAKIELLRLVDDLSKIDANDFSQVYINIGARSRDMDGVLRQFPTFLARDALVILVDLFPTKPSLIDELGCIEIEPNVYQSEELQIRVYNTLFPTFQKIHNHTEKIKSLRDKSIDSKVVDSFYSNLIAFASSCQIPIIILNSATFSCRRNLNMELFPELLKIVGIPNVVLMVWPYGSKFFYGFGTTTKVNYSDDCDISTLKNAKRFLGVFWK